MIPSETDLLRMRCQQLEDEIGRICSEHRNVVDKLSHTLSEVRTERDLAQSQCALALNEVLEHHSVQGFIRCDCLLRLLGLPPLGSRRSTLPKKRIHGCECETVQISQASNTAVSPMRRRYDPPCKRQSTGNTGHGVSSFQPSLPFATSIGSPGMLSSSPPMVASASRSARKRCRGSGTAIDEECPASPALMIES